jgi:6-pyruvoyltetrahydropterin/6-carboxytetrahydropterin synthase
MHVELRHAFRFEAAHRLPHVPENHPCTRLHGHSYVINVHLEGETDPITGWLVDFGEMQQAVEPVIAELDHRCLNDVDGLDNPTSETLAAWLWRRLAGVLPGLSAIEVSETPDTSCMYRGDRRGIGADR